MQLSDFCFVKSSQGWGLSVVGDSSNFGQKLKNLNEVCAQSSVVLDEQQFCVSVLKSELNLVYCLLGVDFNMTPAAFFDSIQI